jgi:hypothetical protein
MLPKEYVNYQYKLYWIYRKVKHSQVKEGSLTDLKNFWMCDMVVRNRVNNDDTLLFMREIEEAKIVKDLI